MLELKIKVPVEKNYDAAVNDVCSALVGNNQFINNDIIVSEDLRSQNTFSVIIAGGPNNHRFVQVDAEFQDASVQEAVYN